MKSVVEMQILSCYHLKDSTNKGCEEEPLTHKMFVVLVVLLGDQFQGKEDAFKGAP